MHRLTVALLSAVDAAIAVAVGIAVTLAPLTLLFVFTFGAGADWSALWPAAVAAWQFGNLVPLLVTLPAEYVAATGIDPAAASFTLSLAPLAFAGFTMIFAARSGVRASRAEGWATGVGSGTLVFGVLATLAGFTSQNLIADAELWQAILVPTLVFGLSSLAGAVVTEWREAGAGTVARLRDRVEAAPHGWGETPGLIARGTAAVVVGLIGLGALVTALAVLLRGGEVVALFQAGNVDALGAVVVTLAQLAYLPTLAVWGMAFAAGPGFVFGDGTAVSPSGTQIGVVPGIPILGAIPESTTPWLLLLALVPVALGALAGWIARSRLVATHTTGVPAPAASDDPGPVVLTGLLASAPVIEPDPDDRPAPGEDPIAARLAIAAGIAVASAAAAALLAAIASGSLGPGRLAHVGPEPGPVALAVGIEVLVGASILLLSPRGRSHAHASREDVPSAHTPFEPHEEVRDAAPAPLVDEHPTLDLGPRRPGSGAPVD